MKTIRFLLLLGCCLLCRGASRLNVSTANPEAAGMNRQRVELIPVRMKDYVDAHKAAGMVAIVARHGVVAGFDAVGYQDLESQKPMSKDTMFRIASLTKPITCAGIMILVDEGRISVIDPVEKFLPEYKGIKLNNCVGRSGYGCTGIEPSRPINIEDLMTHTSGLGNASARGGAEPTTLADLAALGAKTELLFNPGTKWNYSNTGYDVLGRIIEVVSKQPYDEFLRDHIFGPLGMKDTYFFVPDAKVPRIATLYTQTDSGLERAKSQWGTQHGPKIPMPAGGIVSTAEDIFRFNMMMRNKGELDGRRVLSNAAVTLMTTSHTGDIKAGWAPGVGHGYGYEVVRDAEGMFRYNSIGSYVKGGAYRTYEWVDPEKDLVGVFMMQLTNGGGDTADEINSFMEMSAAAIER
ncbi:MAG TPA: serine hydrolase domain-containing protein [Bryobacteraceae bacterium]|nr:serine hydrolase domain-containing protein [Bryobacteraceae bacterium]